MIAFPCQWCGEGLQVDAAAAGRRVRCRRCGRVTRVPAAGPAVESGSVPAAAEAVPRRPRLFKPTRPSSQPTWAGVERGGWVAVAVGLGLAAVPLTVPVAGFLLFPLKTIIHESGHAATAWLLASPAFPQFDLTYGGGYTHILDRQPTLVAAAYLPLGCVLYRSRGDRRALIGWAVVAAAYTVVMSTRLRDLSILAMGHGAELLLAGVFLYRGLSGRQVLTPVERPLYAAVGLFLVLLDGRFAVRLMTEDAARVAYGDAKGGGHWMDFDRIARTLHWPLERVAGVFLVACILTPVAAYLVHRYVNRPVPGREAA